jgi:NAD(P)-dependent dehydrogenase (short-subunit alcohol dehydrogenase family)
VENGVLAKRCSRAEARAKQEEGLMGARGVVVTGGASGIGLATARQLLSDGWHVALADRDPAALERARAELAAGDRAIALEMDVTDETAVARAVAEAAERIGPVKGLVNSAGIAQDKPFADITAAEFRRILDVNVVGSFLVARACAPLMGEAGGGAIVNIASISGLRGSSGRTAYGASKGAVITMTMVMAAELVALGIRVNAIAPGPVDTPMVQQLHTAESREMYEERVLQRRYGTPEEMAQAIVFLLDDARASYITGQILAVDGGFSAAGIVRRPTT